MGSITSPTEEEDFMLPRITGSLTDPKLIPAGGIPVTTSSTPCETLLVNTTTIATGTASTTVGTDSCPPPSESVLHTLGKGTKKLSLSPERRSHSLGNEWV